MTESLILNPFWKTLGASFIKIQGWDLPASFAGIEPEYRAAHQAAALIDRSHCGKIHVGGADALEVLQNILTQDLRPLKPGQGSLAALLSASGQVLRLMEIYRRDEGFLLMVEPGLALRTIEQLQRYVITEDVRFEDLSRTHAWLLLRGPRVQECLPGGMESLPAVWPQEKGGVNLCLPADGAEAVVKKILQTGQTAGLIPCGYETAEILRIEAGILRDGVDITEEIRLPETGLDLIAASEIKGCYPGQEVVARTRTYGGPKRRMVQLSFAEGKVPAPGDKILKDGKETGWITSACVLPDKKGRALGYERRDA